MPDVSRSVHLWSPHPLQLGLCALRRLHVCGLARRRGCSARRQLRRRRFSRLSLFLIVLLCLYASMGRLERRAQLRPVLSCVHGPLCQRNRSLRVHARCVLGCSPRSCAPALSSRRWLAIHPREGVFVFGLTRCEALPGVGL